MDMLHTNAMKKPGFDRPEIQRVDNASPTMAKVFEIRREVFVEEQLVPLELELDGLDEQAVHFAAVDTTGVVVGALRIVLDENVAKIGRVCVRKDLRGQDIGKELMRGALEWIDSQDTTTSVTLEAQMSAEGFYQKLGFQAVGEIFMDAGIPHIKMQRDSHAGGDVWGYGSSKDQTMDYLAHFNAKLAEEAKVIRGTLDAEWDARPKVASESYVISRIVSAVAERADVPSSKIEVRVVDRSKFGADLGVLVSAKLAELGNERYVSEFCPQLADSLTSDPFLKQLGVVSTQVQGVYLNLVLDQSALFGHLSEIVNLGDDYGRGSRYQGQRLVIDYSHPNIGKALHAGHIRSTILGHMMAKQFEWAGGQAYRMNHINDWGGFGSLIEGAIRWEGLLKEFDHPNQFLAFLYRVIRISEKVADSEEPIVLSDEEGKIMAAAYGDGLDSEALKEAASSFRERARQRFHQLESGEKVTVDYWSRIRDWSLDDYQSFYRFFGVNLEFLIGESFFAARGREIVEKGLVDGTVVRFDAEMARQATEDLRRRLDSEEITREHFDQESQSIQRDIGSYLVSLDDGRRVVVQRSDGGTIYATRDLAAIEYRAREYNPLHIAYVVGKEQSGHFQDVFDASRKMGLVGPETPKMLHLQFGFYVDGKTKSKLSSREGAGSVNQLMTGARAYFLERTQESRAQSGLSEAEVQEVAQRLAVGSIIFNDIKGDRGGSVEIFSDIRKACEEFEKGGGAYVMYSCCRAKGILRKYQGEIPNIASLVPGALSNQELDLIKKLLLFPNVADRAAEAYNPTAIARYLLELCKQYNSYYHSVPVLTGDENEAHRLLLTKVVAQVIENGLKICHIRVPERM